MLSFDFKKSNRKCYKSEREFQPGDEFYSALVECDDGSTERRDFSADQWDGPGEGCIGWWRSRVPEVGKGRVFWAPKKVLLAYFEHVCSSPQTTDVAFVMGILLAQKKILSIMDDGGDDSNMALHCRSSKENYTVPVVDISPQRLNQIQDELSERLFMDQPIGDDGEEDEPADAEQDNE